LKVAVLPEGKDPDDVIRENNGTWQQLLDEALPVVDYTIRMVTTGLDLTKAGDKSLAVNRLLPIIAVMKDYVRRDHYLVELSRLTGVNYSNLEAALKQYQSESKARQTKRAEVARSVQPLLSRPIEKECLALLLQHPELKNIDS